MNKPARRLWAAALMLFAGLAPAGAAQLVYELEPLEVGDGCFVLPGSNDYFTAQNGGNIANTGFVVTTAGVVVIDTGPSLRYGQAMRETIARVAGDRPIERVIITHAHPDHYLGNQAFTDVPIYGGPGTVELIEGSGEDFAVNMYRLVGDWMRGTESIAPGRRIEPGPFSVGDHDFRLYRFAGHTGEDLVLLDETCGVLYAGDLVFNARTLSTPHADIGRWLESLERLRRIPYDVLVPGHGDLTRDDSPISQTVDYLEWLEQRLRRAFDAGLDITEVMELPLPQRFAGFALARDEYRRSVHNLYPAIEASNLPRLAQ